MRFHAAGLIILAALCGAFAAHPGQDADVVRKEKDWTVNDLPRDPRYGRVIPISNDVILANSQNVLKEHPEDVELKYQTIELARMLVRPQAPSPLAWKVLIENGVLKDGMSMNEAKKILGSPTYLKEDRAEWYFNFENMHVFPGLRADLDNGVLKNWEVYSG